MLANQNSSTRVVANIYKLVILFFLTSCGGFHPIYKQHESHALPKINITPINSVEGAELYRHLSDIIGNDDEAIYQLQIKLEYLILPLVISKDSDVTLQSVTLIVHFDLLDRQTRKLLKSENIKLVGSYNTAFSHYISHTAEEAEKVNLATNAAGEIQKRLCIFYNSQLHAHDKP
jgi:hypothetical protein